MKQRSRLQCLVKAINTWLELPKTSRSIITADIVESVERLGLTEPLAEQGIAFASSDNPYNDMRVNAQKLFRWLGLYTECETNPERLFFVEQAIVAALPESIRLDYLADIYGRCDVCFSPVLKAESHDIDAVHMATYLMKEQGEAQLAVVKLQEEYSEQQLEDAIKEVSEGISAGNQTLQILVKARSPKIKAVE